MLNKLFATFLMSFLCFSSNAQFTKTNFARNATIYNTSGHLISEYHGNQNFQRGYLTASNVDADGGIPLGIMVTATLPNGATQWSKFIASADSLRVFAVTYDDRDNSYIFVGYTVNYGYSQSKNTNVALLKVDSWGNAKWLRSFYTNDAPCAACYFVASPAYMSGIDILKVKSDPRPNSSQNDFVVVGFLGEHVFNKLITSFGAARRNFIWRFSTDLADDPQITTKFFKTYHGAYFQSVLGTFEPTNFDVPISVKEIDGEGFFVTGTTKDTGYHFNCLFSSSTTPYSTAFNPYYGLINYDAGGSVNTGSAFFKYAYFHSSINNGLSSAHSRNAVRIYPDYSTNRGFILLNNYDRYWFEILPINLATGLPIYSNPKFFAYTTPNIYQSGWLVSSNISYINNNLIVSGYVVKDNFGGINSVDPFTVAINKNNLSNTSGLTINRIKSSKYVNYTPLGNNYDFYKTFTTTCPTDSLRSVINPVNSISNSFLGRSDIISTSPHFTTYNLSDTVIAQAITSFTNIFSVSCKKDVYQVDTTPVNPVNLIDYRQIALVDTILPLFKFNLPVSTLNNPLEINCASQKNLYRFTSVQDIENEQLSIYPNPTSGIINISHTDWRKATLTDITGKEILRLNEPAARIDLSRCTSGIYFLTVYLPDNRKQNFKIVLK